MISKFLDQLANVLTIISVFIFLQEKGYLIRIGDFIITQIETKAGRIFVSSCLYLIVIVTAMMGVLAGFALFLKHKSLVICMIPIFLLPLSSFPFVFTTYKLLYEKNGKIN